MPDDRPTIPHEDPADEAGVNGADYPLDIDRDELIRMLEEGIADLEAGRVLSMEEVDRMIDEALAEQRAELAGKR